MRHEGEYHLIDRDRLDEFEKQGWTLAGYVRWIGHVGVHHNNVLIKRPTSKLPKPDPPVKIPR